MLFDISAWRNYSGPDITTLAHSLVTPQLEKGGKV